MDALLHVVCLPLLAKKQIARDLRMARLSREQVQDEHTVLFFCNLPDADAKTLPEDADLIRCVQSGVMSMNARRPGRYLFFVRERVKSASLRRYLGISQLPDARETMRLLLDSARPLPFAAANFAASTLRGRFSAVLITSAALHMLPDAPARMFSALRASKESALRGQIHIPPRRDEPVFVRLLRAGFSLNTPLPGDVLPPLAAIYRANALGCAAPAKEVDCAFVLSTPPTLAHFFVHAAVQDASFHNIRLFLPLIQLCALLLCAGCGWQFGAFLFLLLPELISLLHPSLLPGALVRLCFLPRRAIIAANTVLRPLFSRRRFLFTFSDSNLSCVFFGAALLLLAVRGIGALATLLPVCLLWFGAPMIDRALALPARERIPLNAEQQRALHTMAESAFLSLAYSSSPAHLLCACAGCMLGLLEPDEAARRAEHILEQCEAKNAFDACCLLVSAQFFSEHMAQCDAALRALPAHIEAKVRSACIEDENTPLATLLDAALHSAPTPQAIRALEQTKNGSPMDALFLPPDWLSRQNAPFALTHPHTFLRQQALPAVSPNTKSDPPAESSQASRFLVLSYVALGAPYSSLLLRSALVAPYAPLLDLAKISP